MCCCCESKSTILCWVTKLAKLLIVLFAINAGLSAAGIYDFFLMLQGTPTELYIKYLVGISGVYCLVMCVLHRLMCRECKTK